jgi:lambda family phage minor tail protein L
MKNKITPNQKSGLVLWYDAADADTITKDGSDLVSQISDKSGEDNHATASGGDRPTYSATAFNGKPCLVFADTHKMSFDNIPGLHTGNTVFAVIQSNQDSSSNSSGSIIKLNGVGGSDQLPEIKFHKNDTNVVSFLYDGLSTMVFTDSLGLDDGVPFLGICGVSAAPLQAFASVFDRGNKLVSSGTPSLPGSSSGTGVLGNDDANGYIAELVVYDRRLTNSEIMDVARYLGEKWGVFVTSPVHEEAQKLNADRIVKMYELDCTNLGGDIYRFISSIDTTVSISSITSSGVLATAITDNNHLLEDGDMVRIHSKDVPQYKGDFLVTVNSPTSFSFTTSGEDLPEALESTMTRLNSFVYFNGNAYIPVAFDATGFEWAAGGTLPTPKIMVQNTNKVLQGALQEFGDLVGAKFTRIRTFRKFLDDGDEPDSYAIFPRDVFRINRKSNHNKVFIEFELSVPFDQEGAKIPARQCLKNTCTHRYRRWDATNETFDYSKATCPYAGTTYFNDKDEPTASPAEDKCARFLDSCVKRFGIGQPLPTRAFPGIGGAS